MPLTPPLPPAPELMQVAPPFAAVTLLSLAYEPGLQPNAALPPAAPPPPFEVTQPLVVSIVTLLPSSTIAPPPPPPPPPCFAAAATAPAPPADTVPVALMLSVPEALICNAP